MQRAAGRGVCAADATIDLERTASSRVTADDLVERFSAPRERLEDAYHPEDRVYVEREPALVAEQIMSSPVQTLPEDAGLAEAWLLIRDRRFRHVPVLDHKGQVVGILSDRDLLREAAGISSAAGAVPQSPAWSSIRSLITRQVVTATPDTDIRQIARVFFEDRIGAMPIVEEKGGLVGLITRSDILRAIINHAPLEMWL